MKIELTARNLDISDELRSHVEKKLAKVEKYFEKRIPAQVVLKAEKDRQIAEITLPVDGMVVRGEEATDDIYASVNLAVDKIERQLDKYRARFQRRKREGRASVRTLASAEAVAPAAGDADEPRIMRTKRFSMKPMHVDEAILQMNLLGHDFYLFRSSETEQVSAVYRRRDGNYGLIEPE